MKPVKRSPAFEEMRRRRREFVANKRGINIGAQCAKMRERERQAKIAAYEALSELKRPGSNVKAIIRKAEAFLEEVIADRKAFKIARQKYGSSQIRAGLIEDMDRNLQSRKMAKEFNEETIKEFQGLLQDVRSRKAEKGIK